MGKNRFKDDSYNAKYGIGGRVGKDDFSIDGKSWDYRDPENLSKATSSRGDRGFVSGRDDVNPNSYDYTNKLYDYSYGAVRDAGKAINVTNVNNKGDVKDLLDYLQNGPEDKPAEKAPVADEQQSPVAIEPYVESKGLSEAKERVSAYEENARQGTENNPYAPRGSKIDFSDMVYGSTSSEAPANRAQEQLEAFKTKLKDQTNLQPTLGN